MTVATVTLLPFAAALSTLMWCFCAGMVIFSVDTLFTGLGVRATEPADVIYWMTLAFTAKAFVLR